MDRLRRQGGVRGTFNLTRAARRAEGARRTRLFVLPSTSPANAAVPWPERERWFGAFRGRPWAAAAVRLVLDPGARVLMVGFACPSAGFWARRAAGSSGGEAAEQAFSASSPRRSGSRASGRGLDLPATTCSRTDAAGRARIERYVLVRAHAFERLPVHARELAAEFVTGMAGGRSRSWLRVMISSHRPLPSWSPLVRDGPPGELIDVGV